MLEGSRLCGKETSSPKPESGERWTPFCKVTLVPEDRETQWVLPPSSVLLADVCLIYVFFYALSRLYNCRHCLLSRSLVCHCLLPPIKPWSLISVSESFSEQVDSCRGN